MQMSKRIELQIGGGNTNMHKNILKRWKLNTVSEIFLNRLSNELITHSFHAVF